MKKDSILYTVVFTFGSTFVLVFLLALAYVSTKPIVEKNNKVSIAEAYLKASGMNISGDKDIEKIFEDTFKVDKTEGKYLKANVNNEDILVSSFSGKGLWGTVTGVLAVDSEFKKIIGMQITSHSETPGLGGRIDEDWFKDQFTGENITNPIKITQSGGSGDNDKENGVLDGITGATRTSESIETMINNHIEELKKVGGK